MLNTRFGIHSGLWYSEYKISNELLIPGNYTLWVRSALTVQSIKMPLCLVTVLYPGTYFQIDLLAGINLSFVFRSNMYLTRTIDTNAIYCKTFNALPILNNYHAGATGGINFKFKIGGYVDFFVGGLAEIDFNSLTSGGATGKNNPYDFRGISGIMFRTNMSRPADDD
jgi:hypothetical protein